MYKTSTQSNRYCKTTVQKVWGAKSKKKFVCRVSDADTRHITEFAECRKVTLGIYVGLPSVVFWHLAYRWVCRVLTCDTQQNDNGGRRCYPDMKLPCVYFLPSAGTRRTQLCREFCVCRVSSSGHSANMLFAECPKSCPRQSWGHSATYVFPVVN